MGQLLVKKSTFGTQKLIEEREKNIQSFENKIQERQNIVRDLQAKVIKMSSNKNKASDLKLQIKRWIQDIEEAKRTVIFLDKENLQLSEINYEDRISDQKKELKRLEEEKFKLIEKSNLSKERLIKIQEADDRKKMILNNKISDIEKEEQKLEAKLNELKNKKNVLKD